MTTRPTKSQHQASAQPSTGTAGKKPTPTQNAHRHGATARPDPETVALWLKVILGKDALSPDDLHPTDATGRAALQLAQAEAKRLAAELATDAAITPEPERGSELALFEEIYVHIEDLTFGDFLNAEGMREAQIRLKRAAKWMAKLSGNDTRRLDLLIRYEREAQLARRKALDAWLTEAKNSQRPIPETK